MTTHLPIACTLSAPELERRLAEMSAVGGADLVRAQLAGSRATLRFTRGPDTAARLAAIVEAEAACCAFLEMSLRDDGPEIALSINAPAGAEPVLEELVAAFGGDTARAA